MNAPDANPSNRRRQGLTLIAIAVGSVLGSALLAWTAKVGCDTGLSSAGLMHQACGSAFD